MSHESAQPVRATIESVPPIEKAFGIEVRARDELKEYVETPLLAACETFWDKGIRTVASSCNAKDLNCGNAYIIIDYDHLSPENRALASSITAPHTYVEGGPQTVEIRAVVNKGTPVDGVSRAFNRVAGYFKEQRATWVPSYTLHEVSVIAEKGPGDTPPQEFAKEAGLYWDAGGERFYPSEELYRMATR